MKNRPTDKHDTCLTCRICAEDNPCTVCANWTSTDWKEHRLAREEKRKKRQADLAAKLTTLPRPPSTSHAASTGTDREAEEAGTRSVRSSSPIQQSDTPPAEPVKRTPRKDKKKRKRPRPPSSSDADSSSPSSASSSSAKRARRHKKKRKHRHRKHKKSTSRPQAFTAEDVQRWIAQALEAREPTRSWDDPPRLSPVAEFATHAAAPDPPLEVYASDSELLATEDLEDDRASSPPTLELMGTPLGSPIPASGAASGTATQDNQGTAASPAEKTKPPEESFFPPQPPLDPPMTVEQAKDLIALLERTIHLGASTPPTDPSQSASRRLVMAPARTSDPLVAVPLDETLASRFTHWAKGSPRDWTAYGADLARETRMDQPAYESILRLPPIPEQVWDLLRQPPTGAPAASGGGDRPFRLNNAAAQKREETLKAIDRSNRANVRFMSLAIWTVEALHTTLRDHPIAPPVREVTDKLILALSQLAEASVDQSARTAARITRERRENILPLMGLADSTQQDLRRLPTEGPDLFNGRFADVLARRAGRQDDLRKNKKFLAKTPGPPRRGYFGQSRGPSASARPARDAFPRPRTRPPRRRRPPASASRPPAADTTWSGQVQVSNTGARSFPAPRRRVRANTATGAGGRPKPF